MNLRQLKTFCEIIDSGLRISDAAQATYRSQSSVTRQIQLLEKEVGVSLFVRKRNMLVGTTPQGEEILKIARRMLQDAESMRCIGRNARHDGQGDFTIATTHTQARYVLPRVIGRFIGKYPKVKLSLRQGTPQRCCELVAVGKADIAICSGDVPEELSGIPCYRLNRGVITTARHPLLRLKSLTLETLAQYPLITHDEAYSGAWIVSSAFSDRNLSPTIVLSTVDVDVSKIYVGLGLGIAIAASVAFDPGQDANLRFIDARHLFRAGQLNLVLRRNNHLRSYVAEFISMFSPQVDKVLLDAAIFGKGWRPPSHANLPEPPQAPLRRMRS